MKRKTKVVLLSSVTGFLTILTIGSIVGNSIANKNSAAINSYFDLLPYKLVDDDNGDKNTEYFKSSFVTNNGNYDDAALWNYDLRVAQQIVNEGTVLLWNNNDALPLNKGAAVSLFGNTSVNMVYTGTGSGSINVADAITLRDGMKQYQFVVNEELWNFYDSGNGSKAKGYGITQKGSAGIATNEPLYTREVPWNVIKSEDGLENSFSNFGESAIFVLGRSGGEGGDLANMAAPDTIGGNYLQLSETERDVLDHLIDLKRNGTFKSVILLLNSANAMQMDLIASYRDKIDACLWVGQPGVGGAPGIAKILCGNANPSGRLVDTYVYDNNSSPAMKNFYLHRYGNTGDFPSVNADWQTAYTVYQEGIYVGYKYYETRYEDYVLGKGNAGNYSYKDTVCYPFGFGNSYSKFEFSDYRLSETKDGYDVKIKVSNKGSKEGRQVAQLYLQKPYTDYDKEMGIEKSAVELVGYNKTRLLKPGENEVLNISVPKDSLKSYDSYGHKTYIREAGDYHFAIGFDAHDAINNILAFKASNGISIDRNRMVDSLGKQTNGNESMVKKVSFGDLDTDSFSKSKHTGEIITNQFDFADINLFDGNGDQRITYLTRKDWENTMPKDAPSLKLTQRMADDLNSKRDLSETKRDADEFYAKHGEIKYSQDKKYSLIQMKGLPYDSPLWDELLNQMSWDEQAELCSNGYHTTALVESINKPATRDENGPLGISVTFSTSNARKSMGWPCEPTRAATFNTKLNELFGKCVGEDMLHAKVTGLWGYGLNIHRTPYSGRNFEYYSEDSFLSGETCTKETIGTQSKGAFVMVKHFAANDAETQRHGNNEWMNEQTLREIYLAPFEKEFTEGKAGSTMTSYNRLGNQWSGGCYNLMTNVLRKEWGWLGYASSDYAGQSKGNYGYYQNVYTGIQAGCDTYDANFHKDEYESVKDDPVIQYCLRISSKRICNTILNTAVMNGMSSSTRVVYLNTWWENALIGLMSGLGVLTASFAIWTALEIRKLIKEKKEVVSNEKVF